MPPGITALHAVLLADQRDGSLDTMAPLENLLAFALAAFVIIVIPGPSVMFVIGRSLALGRIAGLLSVLGNLIGAFALVVIVGIGLGSIVANSAVLFAAIKIAGALTLIWLGVQAIRHRGDVVSALPRPVRVTRVRQVVEGAIVGLTNPKGIAFMAAVLPQFVSPGAGSPVLQMFELGVIFIMIGALSDTTWALMAAAARHWFAKSPKRLAALGATGGSMMIGLGCVMLVTGWRQAP